jgi:anti-sigma factor RsiW
MHEDIELEFELHAYVDGDLDEDSMARVEEHLRNDADAAGRVRAYLRQKDELRALARRIAPTDDAPAIRELGRQLAKRLRPRAYWGWQRAVVVVGLFVVGWIGHMLYAPLIEGPAFAEEAVQAHLLTSSDPSEVLPISQDRLAKLFLRVGVAERLPDLRSFGFDPIGAQLVPSHEGVLLHLPYRDTSGTTVSYFLLHVSDMAELPVHILHKNGVTMAYWQHADERYAVAAPLSDADVSRIAAFLDVVESGTNSHL